MKRYISAIFCALLAMVTLSSCLEHGFEELDVYSGADITGVQAVYYRYKGDNTHAINGEPQVIQVTLSRSNQVIDNEVGTISVTARPASNFPAAQLPNLSAENLVVALNISTAAVIAPIEGSPKLGVPADWSKPNRYRVTAADGTTKDCTVTVTLVK